MPPPDPRARTTPCLPHMRLRPHQVRKTRRRSLRPRCGLRHILNVGRRRQRGRWSADQARVGSARHPLLSGPGERGERDATGGLLGQVNRPELCPATRPSPFLFAGMPQRHRRATPSSHSAGGPARQAVHSRPAPRLCGVTDPRSGIRLPLPSTSFRPTPMNHG